MKKIFIVVVIFLNGCCKQENPANDLYNVSGFATEGERSSNTHPLTTANLKGHYIRRAKRFDYTINSTALGSNPNAVHLYTNADSSANPTHIINLSANGTAKGFIWLNNSEDSLFLLQQWHFTVNTQQHPKGGTKEKILVTKE